MAGYLRRCVVCHRRVLVASVLGRFALNAPYPWPWGETLVAYFCAEHWGAWSAPPHWEGKL